MAACDPAALLESAACFGCLSEKEMDMVIVALLQQWAGNSDTPAQLLDAAKCFGCLGHKELDLATVQLLCDLNG